MMYFRYIPAPRWAWLMLLWLAGSLLLPVSGQTEDATEVEEYVPEGGYAERETLAEPTVREFNRARWVELIEGLNYEEALPERKEPEPEREARPERDRSADMDSAGIALLLKVIGLVVGLIALVVLLYHLFGGGISLFSNERRLRGGEVQLDLENIEENLEATALDSYIERAIREGRYTLAIRLYYLDALKALSANGVVRWKRDKTNGEYLRELGTHPLRADFRAATRTFERIWYGQAPLDEAAFALLQPDFEALTRAASAATPQP